MCHLRILIAIILAGNISYAQSLESSHDGPYIGDFQEPFKSAKVYTLNAEGVQPPGYFMLKYKQQISGDKMHVAIHNPDGDVVANTIVTKNGDKPYYYQITLNPDAPEHTSHYTFNPDGSPLNQTLVDKEGNHIKTIRYKYDADGNLTLETVYDNEGNEILSYRYLYHQDKTEQLIVDKGGEIVRSRMYTYNERGYHETMTLYMSENNKTIFYIYDYEYDEHFNYTSVKTYKDGDYQSMTVREIEY